MSDAPLDLRDQLSIETPELVGIELPLAGIGSRCLAVLLDGLIQGAFFVVVLIVVLLLISMAAHLPTARHVSMGGNNAGKWAIALLLSVPFLLQWGYFALFEAFWNGQTPGKRVMKLRVIQKNGRPIGLWESLARNFIRIIDSLPGIYMVGAICIFATRRQQRLGDLVAGTLVVHSVPLETYIPHDTTRTFTAAMQTPVPPAPVKPLQVPADAVARLSFEDLPLIEKFIARRFDLPLDVRANLAQRLAQSMMQKMQIDPPLHTSHEDFLEGLAAAMREVGVLRG